MKVQSRFMKASLIEIHQVFAKKSSDTFLTDLVVPGIEIRRSEVRIPVQVQIFLLRFDDDIMLFWNHVRNR